MPSTDASLQRYDLSGFTADEREKIVRFIGAWLTAGPQDSFTLQLEGRIVVTNMPPVFVLNQIRAVMLDEYELSAPALDEAQATEEEPDKGLFKVTVNSPIARGGLVEEYVIASSPDEAKRIIRNTLSGAADLFAQRLNVWID